MNTCRCKQHCCHSAIHARENKSFKGSRTSNHTARSLLRLDSTGEVISAQKEQKCLKSHDFSHGGENITDSRRNNQQVYKNFVENLNMDSIINSASAYLDSATSYFGSLCPYKTAKGLVRSNSDGSSLAYLKNMFSGVSQPNLSNSMPAPEMSIDIESRKHSCKCTKGMMYEDNGKSMNWTGNIFGALHCCFMGNCTAKSEKMKGMNTDKYVPPQRRYQYNKCSNIPSIVDPKLTPYNAKLLEKSKRSHSHSYTKKDTVAKNYSNSKTNEANLKPDPQNMSVEKSKNCSQCNESGHNGDCLNSENDLEKDFLSSEREIVETEPQVQSDTEKDWFDYECDNAICIPVSIDKIQNGSKKCEEDDTCTQDVSANSPQLHSWFSIENGNETEKNESNEDSAYNCNAKISDCFERKSFKEAEYNCDSDDKQSEMKSFKQSAHYQASSRSCKAKVPQTNVQGDHSNSDSNSYVLYIRSMGRRGKPSAKKRRRQRAQQNEKNDQSSCHNLSSSLNSNSAFHGNSAMALILGYSADRSEKDAHSFHISCDIDDESDWSDSDIESDETCSSIEDDSMFENGLGFQGNTLLGMQCFQVTCSMKPEETTQSQSSSAIDNINLSWKIQVSVKPENSTKKSSATKKVHFAEEGNLATVHPMIAWSHAYQAARKGPWEQYARDRGRFLRKITDGEKLLEPILNQNHRDKIYRERFMDE